MELIVNSYLIFILFFLFALFVYILLSFTPEMALISEILPYFSPFSTIYFSCLFYSAKLIYLRNKFDI